MKRGEILVPVMHKWSISVKDFSTRNTHMHIGQLNSLSVFLYFNYLVSVTAGGPESPRGYM